MFVKTNQCTQKRLNYIIGPLLLISFYIAFGSSIILTRISRLSDNLPLSYIIHNYYIPDPYSQNKTDLLNFIVLNKRQFPLFIDHEDFVRETFGTVFYFLLSRAFLIHFI